ncbi:Uncharacterised protein [Pseudomonas aeruginosa]|nr:Uncharacterised protein [Pseudomonas aeruginosa]
MRPPSSSTPRRGRPHERDRHHAVQPLCPWPPDPPQSHRHAADDPFPRRQWRSRHRADGRVLQPARRRRPDRFRRHPDQPAGPGLRLDAGHPQRRAGRRLAPGHRRGARRRRAHLRPALARRQGLAHLAATGQRRPGVLLGAGGRRREGLRRSPRPRSAGRRRRDGPALGAARAGRGGNPGDRRRLCPGRTQRPRRRLRRGRTARRQRLPDQPVHRLPGPMRATTNTAARWRTACASSAKSPRRSPRWSAGSASACAWRR